MSLNHVDHQTVRDALRSVRYARPLAQSPLITLDALELRLRREGMDDSPAAREWALIRLLQELIDDGLAEIRTPHSAEDTAAATAATDLAQLVEDFRHGDLDLEALSLLRFRYYSTQPVTLEDAAAEVGVTYRTVARRLSRGYRLLARALRAAELAATKQLRQRAAPSASQRVVITTDRTLRPTRPSAAAALRAAVRSSERSAELSAEALEQLASHPPDRAEDYCLARIAHWLHPERRLDARYVDVTMRLELPAEPTPPERERRFGDLRQALDAIETPTAVVLGPPGSGKTTLLQRLELQLASEHVRHAGGPIPILVSLAQLRVPPEADALPDPADWLASQWARRWPRMPPLVQLMDRRPVVLLLDGLGEMSARDAAQFRALVRAWKAYTTLVTTGRGTRFVFTCRRLDYTAPLSSPTTPVPQLHIAPWSDDQVRAFLNRRTPSHADGIWDALVGRPQLELLRRPYLLSLLAEDLHGGGQLPHGRAAIFTHFVRRALRREIERDHPLFLPGRLLQERDYVRVVGATRWRTPHELPERGRLFTELSALGLAIQRRCRVETPAPRWLPFDAVLAQLGAADGADIIRAGQALGILDEDRGRDEVGFSHQLMQEYFAARALAAQPEQVPPALWAVPWRADTVAEPLDAVLERLAPNEALPPLPGSGWSEVLPLAVAMTADPLALLDDLVAEDLPLAGRCAVEPDVCDELPAAWTDRLRHRLVARSRDPAADLRARLAAGHALGRLGDPRLSAGQGADGPYLEPTAVDIPGGRYPIGDEEPFDYLGTRWSAHCPRHEVGLAPFGVAIHPVTNAEWACFQAAGGYEDPRWWPGRAARAWQRGAITAEGARANNRYWRARFRADDGVLERFITGGTLDEEAADRWRRWIGLSDAAFERAIEKRWPSERLTSPALWNDERFNHPALPVVGISWYEARAYCRWLAAQTGRPYRLPTEVEWEAAARGTEGRSLPFGGNDGVGVQHANGIHTHLRRPSPVGVFPAGNTPHGIADLLGNVHEWTASAWGTDQSRLDFAYPYDADDGREADNAPHRMRRVLRGGGWNTAPPLLRPAVRHFYHPTNRAPDVGVRLALTPDAPAPHTSRLETRR